MRELPPQVVEEMKARFVAMMNNGVVGLDELKESLPVNEMSEWRLNQVLGIA
jgi:hypothetical protein